MTKIPSWDLSDLFSSIEDPNIEKTIEKAAEEAKIFKERYRGKLRSYAEPSQFLIVIREYEAIWSELIKPQVYAELVFTVDSVSSSNGAFLQRIKTRVAEISSELIFFDLELGNFSDELFSDLIKSESLLGYRHYFEKILQLKPFRLSEAEEKIIEMKELTGRQALIRLFDQELSRQKYHLEVDSQKLELAQSEILNILYTEQRQQVRAAAAKCFTQGLVRKEDIFAFVTNTLAENKKIDDNLRGFKFPEQSRHLSNEASPQAIESMCKIVEQFHGLVQEYYVFKGELLGLEKLYDYDRYAPYKSSGKEYSFDEAKEIVLSALEGFDSELQDIAKEFFDKKWIDAAISHGKRGGAYCQPMTPSTHAYVFMNFAGTANDVMTLAHELGHAIHFELARKQSLLSYDVPLTLAETASIFAETLTFSKLVSMTDDKEVLLGLYMQKIESIFASVQRQISMYRFEQDLHGEYREKGELSKSRINELWKNRQQQMFGDSVTFTSDFDNWWMYIPHFVATPFYVYAYAFGELLAFGLFEKLQKDPEKIIRSYKEFLSAGSSKSPQELAGLFDIDLEDDEFWRSGMHRIEEYFQKAKKLYSER